MRCCRQRPRRAPGRHRLARGPGSQPHRRRRSWSTRTTCPPPASCPPLPEGRRAGSTRSDRPIDRPSPTVVSSGMRTLAGFGRAAAGERRMGRRPRPIRRKRKSRRCCRGRPRRSQGCRRAGRMCRRGSRARSPGSSCVHPHPTCVSIPSCTGLGHTPICKARLQALIRYGSTFCAVGAGGRVGLRPADRDHVRDRRRDGPGGARQPRTIRYLEPAARSEVRRDGLFFAHAQLHNR